MTLSSRSKIDQKEGREDPTTKPRQSAFRTERRKRYQPTFKVVAPGIRTNSRSKKLCASICACSGACSRCLTSFENRGSPQAELKPTTLRLTPGLSPLSFSTEFAVKPINMRFPTPSSIPFESDRVIRKYPQSPHKSPHSDFRHSCAFSVGPRDSVGAFS